MMKIIYLIIFYFFSEIKLIENGVYKIMYRNLYFNFENKNLQISKSLKKEINSFFRIKKSSHQNNKFYSIQHINTNLKIICFINGSIVLKLSSNQKEEFNEWTFIEKEKNKYVIQSKNLCKIKIKNYNIIKCENITLKETSIFYFIKIYEEVDDNSIYNYKLIEKEPIDLIIKYIDLRDPFLKRNEIHQIKKDYDNEELRYSLRSIIKNIPWIRRIYIIMPNEKVRFLKNYNNIKDKIIYVKDKDLLGFDSSNSLAFQFRYWKLKDLGISDNIIAMDDDCFIGKYLNKSDFFYIHNGKVTPIIMNNNFIELNYNIIKKKLKEFSSIISKTNDEQTSIIFKYSLYSTYLFVLKLFNEAKYFPTHTHNAISINLNELKEIYNLIYKSEYKNNTLFSLYRHINSLQFQALVLSYTFIKYKRKIKNISYKLIDNKYSLYQDYNFSLFCINTGSIYYSISSFMKSKIIMEYLFPFPTKYEKRYNSISLLVFKTIMFIENEYSQYKKKKTTENLKKKIIKKKNELFILKICFILFIICIILF